MNYHRFVLLALTGFGGISLLTSTTDCAICYGGQWGYDYANFDHYTVDPTNTTPSGIAYDPSGLSVDGALIDRLVDEVETCLQGVAVNGELPPDVVSQSECAGKTIAFPINRKSFVVKIASDWIYSCDQSEQLLPVAAPNSGCVAKGETPTAQCPCEWRAGIKCPNAIITTPSLYLFKDPLIRFITSCKNPWANSQMAVCATPSVPPL